MPRIEQFSLELRGRQGSVPEWTDALSTRLGHGPLSLWDEELTRCQAVGHAGFVGQIEHAHIGGITLARLATTTPHHLLSAPRDRFLPFGPVALFQTSGCCQFEQKGRHCRLYPGDWCVVDNHSPLRIDALDSQNENLLLRLECPSDAETLSLVSNAAARRWSAATGTSRILRATVAETFDQLNCLSHLSDGLERPITALVWQAVREQLEAPATPPHSSLRLVWAKRFIESRLHDPRLSADAIAEGCGISVRSLHRAFSEDSTGSVSRYLWTRRLDHCAAALRDPQQRHRSLTEICFAWGFNSSAHFSRIFKERFGLTPSEYRGVSERRDPFEP